MSKKKGKSVARKAPRKTAPRTTATKPAPAKRATFGTTSTGGRTAQATIFIFRTPSGTKIRTAPQRVFAGPGYIEWTVVNLVDGSNVPVTLTWPNGGPLGKEPIEVRDGMIRVSLDGAATGVFKYVVRGLDAVEDPEVEIPEM
jgi:hypothetical protein